MKYTTRRLSASLQHGLTEMTQSALPADPWLLTPGPLSTARATREAMLHDWGSWDAEFRTLTAGVRGALLAIAHGEASHVCVPVQGSGSFAVEATLGTLIPRSAKTLVLANGAYGKRIAEQLSVMGRACEVLDTGDYLPPEPAEVERRLRADPELGWVCVVHCETSSGILNPLAAIAEVVARCGRELIVDAMSSFAALPLDLRELPAAALIASANKCIEGVPGFGFALIRRERLAASAGQAHSLCLDLHAQWRYFERSGQWRYTPPTHVVAAAARALELYAQEGGQTGRLARYTRNAERLVAGMQALGFRPLLAPRWRSPIIVSFLVPGSARFDFERFYLAIKARGYVIYPGKLTSVDSFRIGVIGQLFDAQIDGVLAAVRSALDELDIADGAPDPAVVAAQPAF